MHILHAGAPSKVVGYFDNLLFTHAVHQQVRMTALQNGGQEPILPIVKMHKAAEAGLNAANNNRHMGPQALHHLGINHGGMIRPLAYRPTSSIFIHTAGIFGRCIMAQHGIKIATGNEHTQTGLTQGSKIFNLIPSRLAQQRHLVALGFQHPANNRRTKGRMVHIGITADEQKIQLLPTTFCNFFLGNR